jgi:ABC transport system ATP-binding/permease protein
MLAQRGADLAGRQVPKAKTEKGAKPEQAARTKTARRRLSFNDKHALETLPKQMAALQDKARTLQQRLEDPDLYARDAKAFADASAALAAAQSELSAAEDRWLVLEMLREEIEGAGSDP